MNSYVAIDLETTGLSPKLDKIIEVGAIKVIDGKIIDTYSTYVNPGRVIDERITELTGITKDDVCDAPVINEIIKDIVEFTEDLPLLGHRILFDYSFIKQASINAGISFEKEGIDTLKISRVCHMELPSKKLSDMCAYYGIELVAHRALNDAIAASDLYTKLYQGFFDKYPEQFESKKLIYNVKRESPIRKGQIEKIEALLTRFNIECPYELSKMTRNEASRYYDILRTKCGSGL